MDRLPALSPGQLVALAASHAASETMLMLASRLAQRASLLVLDGGNRFNVYRVAKLLRRQGVKDLSRPLERIRIARAFTCYQMIELLESASCQRIPTLVLDLLDTFYDESAPLAERRRLLGQGLFHLRRLSCQTVVVISLRPPPPPHKDPTGLLQAVQEAVDEYWAAEFFLEIPPAKLFS